MHSIHAESSQSNARDTEMFLIKNGVPHYIQTWLSNRTGSVPFEMLFEPSRTRTLRLRTEPNQDSQTSNRTEPGQRRFSSARISPDQNIACNSVLFGLKSTFCTLEPIQWLSDFEPNRFSDSLKSNRTEIELGGGLIFFEPNRTTVRFEDRRFGSSSVGTVRKPCLLLMLIVEQPN